MNQSTSASPFSSFSSPQTSGSHGLGKRQRNDECSHEAASITTSANANTIFLQRVIEKQNAEIQNLRAEKSSMETTINNFTQAQEKTLHENKILKKKIIKTLVQQSFIHIYIKKSIREQTIYNYHYNQSINRHTKD
jgi:hypothetical protein